MSPAEAEVSRKLGRPFPREALAAFCRRHRVTEFAFFGSILRDDFSPDSDVDVMVTFAPDARPALWDVMGMEDELKEIFGREVDLVTRRGVELSRDGHWKRSVLDVAEVVNVA